MWFFCYHACNIFFTNFNSLAVNLTTRGSKKTDVYRGKKLSRLTILMLNFLLDSSMWSKGHFVARVLFVLGNMSGMFLVAWKSCVFWGNMSFCSFSFCCLTYLLKQFLFVVNTSCSNVLCALYFEYFLFSSLLWLTVMAIYYCRAFSGVDLWINPYVWFDTSLSKSKCLLFTAQFCFLAYKCY